MARHVVLVARRRPSDAAPRPESTADAAARFREEWRAAYAASPFDSVESIEILAGPDSLPASDGEYFLVARVVFRDHMPALRMAGIVHAVWELGVAGSLESVF